MPNPLGSCPHCNGTTFCGGFFHRDKLMTQPACASCLVKSGLPAKGTYHKVICSVCGGTGVRPKDLDRAWRRAQTVLLLWVSPLLIATGAFLALSVITVANVLRQDQEQESELHREAVRGQVDLTGEELKRKVPAGTPKQAVRDLLGQPITIRGVESGPNNMELWSYHCSDGPVTISFLEDAVQNVTQ